VISPVCPVPSVADSIVAAIAASGGGTISFREFMTMSLYGDNGFYTVTGRAGRRGDFITSPEVGPLFGAVLARACDAVWKTLGQPDGFMIVDAGAGPGTLARAILAASPQCLERGSYVAVETSPMQREMHPAGIISTDMMPTHIEHGIVIANELIDNMPFDVWVYDGAWRTARVTFTSTGFAEILVASETPAVLPLSAAHGSRAPIHTDAVEWLRSTLDSLSHGQLLVFDYCTPLTAQVTSMPWREWLRTYVGHERGVHYLKNAGQQDITTQVCVDQLAAVRQPDAVRSQSHFLQRWGIDDLVEEGRRIWTENAAAPTLATMKMRSRVSESEALLDESGLGGFTVLEWSN